MEFFEFPDYEFNFSKCDENTDGSVSFNLPQRLEEELSNPNIGIDAFYQNFTNETLSQQINDPTSFILEQNSTAVFARLISSNNCADTVEISLAKSTGESLDEVALLQCTDSSQTAFDLSGAHPEIEEELTESAQSYTYYSSLTDAENGENNLSETQILSTDNLPQVFYARVELENSCPALVPIRLGIIKKPKVDETYSPLLCTGNGSSIQINAGLIDPGDNLTYEWENGATTPSISVSEPGSYQVNLTRSKIVDGEEYSCTFSRNISVQGSSKAKIGHQVVGKFGDFSVDISARGQGDYVYAVDQNNNFSQQQLFPVNPGEHTLYVKDLNGCGVRSKTIQVLGYMKFFTPNQDGINDRWGLRGIDRGTSLLSEIQIYDRFGKLLTVLPPYAKWDGTFNGKNLPSSEYWFVVKFNSGKTFKGHFTLKR